MTLTLLSYNNYYNRIVKRHETLDDYYNDGAQFSADIVGVNFNPNDGVSTSQIVNADFTASIAPDYALLMDGNTIISRWYIIECVRTRGGQYNLDLLRDLVADCYDKVLSAPMFIEKASLSRNDARIFNNENMTFNKIKTSERLLRDSTRIPWIVGYIARDTSDTPVSIAAEDIAIDYDLTSLNEYQYHSYDISNPYKMSYYDFTAKMYFSKPSSVVFYHQAGWDANGYAKVPQLEIPEGFESVSFSGTGTYCIRKAGIAVKSNEEESLALKQIPEHTVGENWITGSYDITKVPKSNAIDLSDEEGKIIKAGDDYYRIHYHTTLTNRTLATINSTSAYGVRIRKMIEKCDKFNADTLLAEPIGAIEYIANAAYLTYEPIFIDSFSVSITSKRRHTSDVPYDIFAMPYGDVDFVGVIGNPTMSAAVAMSMARQLTVDLGSQLYDIQILPYCPWKTFAGGLVFTKAEEGKDYNWITSSDGTRHSVLLWVEKASFTTELPTTINIKVPDDPIEFKIANECDKYRIVSPTYNGEFEFSATKNNGVYGFTANCTYKPYNPFIRIVPEFKNLYGKEFKDGRGCICQGDFSLPQIGSEWTQYQINNKNFLNAFNRQIQNMETNNAVQRELEKWQVAGGVLSAAGTGAAAGAMVGRSTGAAIGGVVSGVSSAVAGLADIRLNERLRTEALDYTKDQFGYQLGNIAALPYTLANIGAQTIISKYFPFLEYYTATEIEKEALRNKIKYNGMTVMTIGTIEEFQQPTPTYIKGKLIRLEGVEEDFHFVNALANELYKGVFI